MRTISSAFPWNQVKWRSKEEHRIQTLDLALKILVPLILSACLVISLKVGSFDGYLRLLSRHSFGSPLMALGAGFTLAYLAFQLVRTVLWWRYKSYPLPPGPLPRVTVIIPAYNEGAMVEKSIYAAVASDYPADRLEIICIDDGSKDDTWAYIDRARRRYPKLIKAIRFTKNRGKKEGLTPASPGARASTSSPSTPTA
jgi:hyaluronan synthase